MEHIKKALKKYKTMPLNEIVKKIIRKFYKKICYIYKKIKIRIRVIDLEDSIFEDFYSQSKFIYDIDKKRYYVLELQKMGLAYDIVKTADKICEHEFNLLGSGYKNLGLKMAWNEDFRTGFKWENKFYKDINTIDLRNKSDVKVPWELSRFQHIFSTGKAYWLTQNEKYSTEFMEEIEDWIKKNPIEMSVNWTCTMDVAIRAINWISGYLFFKESSSINNRFWIKFNKLLFLHGRFIFKNLENEGRHNGNHYLSNLAGLIWIGIYFKDFAVFDLEKKNNPKNWLQFAISEFENEMDKQVNTDGTDYEASTAYHRLVTEIFLITTILCNKNDIFFSKNYMIKLLKMCEFIMDITKPNGLSPIIGDADDGRLLILSRYSDWNRRDFSHILAVAGEYFNRDDFRFMGREYKEDALWTMGKFKKTGKQPHLSSKSYEKGGYYILRNERVYCIIRCGELSCKGGGCHSHNDQLSIELNVDGEDFIIDPGTYAYTGDYEMRNVFRSTESHNTVSFENIEQNYFNPYHLFNMKEETFSKCSEYNENTFCGEHYGYINKCGISHERKVVINKDGLNIRDTVNKQPSADNKEFTIDKCKFSFMLDAGVNVIEKKNEIELIKNDKRIIIECQGDYKIRDSFISYQYGQKIRTKKVQIKMKSLVNEIKIYLT